jgi:Ulp1 family protease
LELLFQRLPCPQQRHGIDCGQVAVAVVLHLLANHEHYKRRTELVSSMEHNEHSVKRMQFTP